MTTACRGQVTLETIDQPVRFESLREEWNGLLDASTSRTLFLTWEWLYCSWKHLAGETRPVVLVVREGGTPIAAAAFVRAPVSPRRLLPMRRLEFLGTGSVGSDYLDVLIRPGHEEAALEALAQHLAGQNLMIRLGRVARRGALVRHVADRLTGRGWSLAERAAEVCPYIDLSGHSWDSYLDNCGASHRYAFRRKWRKLDSQFDVRFEPVTSEEQRPEALRTLVRLHRQRWASRGGTDAFHDDSLVAFHGDMSRMALEQGWLRLFVLRLDGKPAAAFYGFRHGDVFSFYQSGFDPEYAPLSVGLVLMGLTIRAAIEEQAQEFDLLHGEESYKQHWARTTRDLGSLELYPPHYRGSLYRQFMELRQSAAGIARRALALGGT